MPVKRINCCLWIWRHCPHIFVVLNIVFTLFSSNRYRISYCGHGRLVLLRPKKALPFQSPTTIGSWLHICFFFYCEQTALFSDSLHWIGLIGAKVWDCFLGINNKPCFSCISALTAAIQLKQVFISCQSVVRHANTKENVDYFCIQYITSDG